MENSIDTKIPLIQDADLNGKVVLLRVDHNVVKGGTIRDPYRIDSTLGTIYNIVERGGRPILMTHVGRPRNKKTGEISCNPGNSVEPIVEYLERKLHINFHIPKFNINSSNGIPGIDTSINLAIKELKNRNIGGIYLPNTRWFQGEEGNGDIRENFAVQLAGLADVFVNDAFGSWQSHASTYDITKHLPSFAGFLMQQEIKNLSYVLEPTRPFVAVVAGAKYDTKIGPLKEIYKKVDHLILGGVIYSTFLSAKYKVQIEGIPESDVMAAEELVEIDKKSHKILELPYVVESDTMEGKIPGKYRTISIRDFKEGDKVGYILDVDPKSFEDERVSNLIGDAMTIFVNAVMGFTPHFTAGSEVLDRTIDQNSKARKLYGGGDTLQEFKNLCPGLYLAVLDDAQYYFFTGGGSVLKAIQEGSPYGMEPIRGLIDNGGKQPR
ncbi:MAG: phosphoglycerate kinase [Pseudomonadota bacterium]